MLRRFTVILLSIGFIAFAGCNPANKKATVSGSITLDGVPVANGVIRFEPIAGDTPTASVPFKDGRYQAEVPVGKMRVEITSPKKVGEYPAYKNAPNSPMLPKNIELIPDRYNVKSDEKLDVISGKNTKDFALTSDGKP